MSVSPFDLQNDRRLFALKPSNLGLQRAERSAAGSPALDALFGLAR
jgi:hypothetical protein